MKYFIFLLIFLCLPICSFSQQTIQKNPLYIFVGEKIEVKQFKVETKDDTVIVDGKAMIEKTIIMDWSFRAKYRIIKNIYGNYASDTIEFVAYDHYGEPAFSKYKTVMLFVSEKSGKLIHEKYQFFDVYETKNGRWASHYSVSDYNHQYNKNTIIKPEKIKFKQPVFYDISNLEKEDIEKWYPKPYFKIRKNKAIVIYGNYVEELFEIKKQGFLKARGLF